MLETRLKIAFLLAILFLTSLPVMGILQGTSLTPKEDLETQTKDAHTSTASMESTGDQEPIEDEMVFIAEGPFTRGTTAGGFDEAPEQLVKLSDFSIDKFEVTNYQYQQFVRATGHRKPGPPSRYAKNLSRMRGPNQPVMYVSWEDAEAFCRWKGKRLPTEAEWEKAMRGTDGRLWPWGNTNEPGAANYARVEDGFDMTAPAGSFQKDVSPYGVADGAGNVMEWVADWYAESYYRDGPLQDPKGPRNWVYPTSGVRGFKVLRGGGYTTTGSDLRITSRSKMPFGFRDQTIGFRCALSGNWRANLEG